MKQILFTTILLLGLAVNSQTIKDDKILHFAGSGLLATPSYFLGWDASKGNKWTARITGVAIPTFFGLVKETLDIQSTGFSGGDMLANIGGAILGTAITDLCFQSEGSKKRREDRRIEKEKKRLDEIYN